MYDVELHIHNVITESEIACKFDKKKNCIKIQNTRIQSMNSNKEFWCHLLRIKQEFTRTNVDFIQIFAKSYVIVV